MSRSDERRMIGKYEIVGQLARGGMADVYLARTTGLAGFERLVVVKRLKTELGGDTEQVQAFLDEARIAAALRHANIVQVHDVGVADAVPFLAMELLEGQDCGSILERLRKDGQAVPTRQALAIAVGVCAGIHAAHETVGPDGQPMELIHRDISPENVFVTYDGGVKVIDFGVARATGRLSETRFGLVKGKPSYMSPEQARCHALDRRSDVYAIGVLLYELTTGRVPFVAPNEYELLRAVAEAAVPPPSQVATSYPAELERIVMKALARDREARYPTARELQRDLGAYASSARLQASSYELGAWVTRLFGQERSALNQARADGVLAEHVVAVATGQIAPSPRRTRAEALGPAPSPGARRARLIVGAGVTLGLLVAITLWRRTGGGPVETQVPAAAAPGPAGESPAEPTPAWPASGGTRPTAADPAPDAAGAVVASPGARLEPHPKSRPARRHSPKRIPSRATSETPERTRSKPAHAPASSPAPSPAAIDPDGLLPR